MEAALLDIKGKALGVPVYELLGGKHRDVVGCYGNGWFSGAVTPEDFARKAKEAVAQGFKALKWDPFGAAWLEMDRTARNRTIAIVEAVRSAVGPDIDLMIEVHGRLNVPTAIAMARELARFNPRWFEEPLPPESIDSLADVRANSPIPIATGERYFEPERFMELIHQAGGRYPSAGCGACRRDAGGAEDRGDGACAVPAGGAAQSDRSGDERDDAAGCRDDSRTSAFWRRLRWMCRGDGRSCGSCWSSPTARSGFRMHRGWGWNWTRRRARGIPMCGIRSGNSRREPSPAPKDRCRSLHPHPARVKRADLSRSAGEVRLSARVAQRRRRCPADHAPV